MRISSLRRPEKSVLVRNAGQTGGVPLVYLHGALSNKQIWLASSRLTAARLPNHSGYLIDLAGHGDAPGPAHSSLAEHADDVIHFMDLYKLDKAVVVGHSMGGGVAQEMALRHPDRVAGLVLVSTGLRLGVSGNFLSVVSHDFGYALTYVRQFAFGPEPSDAHCQHILAQMKEIGQQVGIQDLIACRDFSTIGRAAEIRQPAVVLVGEMDRMTRPSRGEHLAQELGTQLRQVPNAGHLLPVEQPDALAELIAEFVRECVCF
jgi:pimeloyl-ACP methyl ester carboxylesterase